jgi:hypothetical protein
LCYSDACLLLLRTLRAPPPCPSIQRDHRFRLGGGWVAVALSSLAPARKSSPSCSLTSGRLQYSS